MLLRRVELIGFKSFAERTIIEFGPGISAIVGPNGSGKSNVVDAVRWVLGEVSARSIRGQRMEDVIFAGSAGRRPLALAEVTLHLDNADGALPLALAEVSVTRRLDRAGVGEYLINRQSCRLRDVQELFAGTGLGRRTFALLGQGEVDDILRARPSERRALVEEAAGVSRFQLRLQEGRRRLQAAEQHLERAGDILRERERVLQELRQEAQRAQRHAELQVAVRGVELALLAREWAGAAAELDAARRERDGWELQWRAAQAALEAVVRAVQQAQPALAAAQAQRQRAASAARAAAAALQQSRQALTVAEQLQQAAEGEGARVRAAASQIQQRRLSLEAELAEAVRAAQLARQRQQEAAAAAQGAEQELAQRRSARAQAEQRLAQLQEELAHLQAALAQASERASRRQRAEALRAEAEGRAAEARAELSAAEARAEAAGEALRAEERRQAARDAALQALRQHLTLLQAGCEGTRGRLQLLRELMASGAGYAQGVRSVLQGRARGLAAYAGVLGPLGDLLDVPSRLAAAIAAALGAAAQDLVTVSVEAAEQAIAALRASQGGRATFLPLGGLRTPELSRELQGLDTQPGAVGWAARLVAYPPQIGEAVEHALGRVLVATDLRAARRLAQRAGLRLRVVTLEGEVVHPGGAMSGGAVRGERPGALVGREAEARRLHAYLQTLDHDRGWLQQLVARLEGAQRAAERAVAARRQEWAGCEAQRAAARARLAASEAEAQRAEGTLQELEVAGTPPAAAPEAQARPELALRAACEEAGRALAAAQQAEQQSREELTHAQVEAAASAQASRGAEGLAAALQRQLQELDGQLQELGHAQRRLDQEVAAQRARAAQAAVALQAATTEAARAEREVQAAEAAELEVAQALAGQTAERERLQQEQDAAAAGLRAAEGRLARAEARLAALSGRLDAGYGLQPAELEGIAPSAQPEADRARLGRLREELAAIGGVRPGAVEDYGRQAEAVEGLRARVEDLLQAVAALQHWLEGITAALSQRYEATLAEVRRHFQASYQRLCGGTADLVPVAGEGRADPPRRSGGRAEEDGTRGGPAAEGLEVVAQPPGKRPAHLELLSGGERALVALALLLAFLQVKPTAFCVLDEVEAALDDANVERLAAYLRSLAEHTQFIVVTHQKGTMQAADRLIGVTMSEAGVSSLVSVRLAG